MFFPLLKSERETFTSGERYCAAKSSITHVVINHIRDPGDRKDEDPFSKLGFYEFIN